LELASPEEQADMIRKRNDTLAFFKDMENNIKYRVVNGISRNEQQQGQMKPVAVVVQRVQAAPVPPTRVRQISSEYSRPTSTAMYGVRTISSIDDTALYKLKQLLIEETVLDTRQSIAHSPDEASAMAAGLRNLHVTQSPHSLVTTRRVLRMSKNTALSPLKSPYYTSKEVQSTSSGLHRRRNSTGTIYVGTTMSTQDNDATISCVCVCIRSHMIDAAKEGVIPLPHFDIFKDASATTTTATTTAAAATENPTQTTIPSLRVVRDFFNLVFKKSQLENECIIIALVYCERLVKVTKGKLCIRHDNWKSILFACLVMASKVWDDMSMWNVDFSQVDASFDLQRINALELAILGELKYAIRVSAGEYAKYYFHLRSMMARLGFHANESSLLEPLDIEQARKLQLATEKFADVQESDTPRPRSKSDVPLDSSLKMTLIQPLPRRGKGGGFTGGPSSSKNLFNKHALVALEQLVHTEHMDADGQAHTPRSQTPRPQTPVVVTEAEQQKQARDSALEAAMAEDSFRSERVVSWNANDDEDFQFCRK